MPKEPSRESDERLLRVLAARGRGETLEIIARCEGVSHSYLSRQISKVRDDDLAFALGDARDEIKAAYQKGGRT